MSDYMQFGVIENLDKEKDYSVLDTTISFKENLEKYHCISIPDNVNDDWGDDLLKIKTYYHSHNRPDIGLARCGVTLIPPNSLDEFIFLVDKKTSSKYTQDSSANIDKLLKLLVKAKNEDKYIIHFGI